MEMSAIAAHPRVAPSIGPRAARVVRPAPAPVRVRQAAEEPARLHLTRRGRVVLVLLALLVVAGGVMGGRAVADGPQQATEVTTHAVVAGETLWQIASSVAAPGEDVRDVVAELRDLNGMADSSLIAGQVLLVPADS